MWDDAKQMNALAVTLALLAALGLVFALATYVVRQSAFAFNEVVVTTPLSRTNGAHLEAVIRAELSGTFFTMDLASARNALTRVPWVRDAGLRRQWPSRLEVTIEEHEPLAHFNEGGFVNTRGEVFDAEARDELPRFMGSEARARAIAIGHLACARLPSARSRAAAPGSRRSTCAIATVTRFACPHSEKRTSNPPHEKRKRMKDNKNLIVGLDIGTSKIVAIVAELSPEGVMNVIGLGSQPSRGLKKGVVVNIETTMATIQRVLEEAELMADCQIKEVYTGIAGSHIRCYTSHGMVAIKEKEVTQADIDRVVETAKAIPIPNDQQILHIVPQSFTIDGQDDVHEPLGMSGVRLEVDVHIVTGAVSAVENVTKCIRRCGLDVRDVILQPLASATAVLSDDEKDLGVCLIDIGGGTSDIAIYTGGAIRHTAVIPIAGDQVTNDIAMTLRTPTKEAEELKVRYGCALRQLADANDIIEVPGVGERAPRKLSRPMLAEVIEPRIEELFQFVQSEVRRSGFEEMISSGVVITGGSALLQGMTELGEEVFHMPVRVGVPTYSGGLADVVKSPRYATTVGLLLEGRDQFLRGQAARAQVTGIGGAAERMKNWFKANF